MRDNNLKHWKHWWPVRDYDFNFNSGKFVQWRYVFCTSRSRDVSDRIAAEFENWYGYRPAAVRRVSPTGRSWLVGPVEGRT